MKGIWDGYVREYKTGRIITVANNIIAASKAEAVKASAAAILERPTCWPKPVQTGLAKAAGGKYYQRGDMWGVIRHYEISPYYPVIQVHLKS